MKKQNLIRLSFFFSLLYVGLFGSCTKTSDPEPQPIDQIVGQWNMSQTCTIGTQASTVPNTLAVTKGSFTNMVKMTYGTVTFDVTLAGKDFTGSYSYQSNAGFMVVNVSGRLVDSKNLEFTQSFLLAARNVMNCTAKATK